MTEWQARETTAGEHAFLLSAERSLSVGTLSLRAPVPAEQQESGERISFWWGLTSAAVALSLELEKIGDLTGERAIELGCGIGLVGCTAALLGATVTFSDYVADALSCARETCRLNGIEREAVRFELLEWEDPSGVETYSLVLGSEIAYDYLTHSALIRLMDLILEPRGIALLAERKRLAVSRFLGRLVGKGYRVSETLWPVAVSGLPEQTISVFRIERFRSR